MLNATRQSRGLAASSTVRLASPTRRPWIEERAARDREQDPPGSISAANPAQEVSWDFRKISVLSTTPPNRTGTLPRLTAAPHDGSIQARLAIRGPDDHLEREADQVADQVMRMPAPGISVTPVAAQLSRKCAACEEEEKTLQTKRAGLIAPAGGPPAIVREVLGTAGNRLNPPERAFFEPRFGRNFADVRIHFDARAARSAREVGALAYTVGQHVVFDSAHYQPGTLEGRRLLAHELVHTVQQSTPGEDQPKHLARKARSLAETLDAAALSDDELTTEIGEIRGWLDANPASSEQSVLMAKSVARLGAELVKRHPPALAASGAPRAPESVTVADVLRASSVAGGFLSGSGAAPQPPLEGPPLWSPPTFRPPTFTPPTVTPPTVTPAPTPPTTTPGVEPIPVPPVAVGVFLFIVIMLWPNTSIMSGSEENKLLEEAKRQQTLRQGFDETDAELDAEASADVADDVEVAVETPQPASGDCTEERHRTLQDDINSKCKRLPRGCRPDMGCQQLKRNWYRNERCARARDKLNNECFKGGDSGHKAAAAAAWLAAQDCRELYRRKKC